MRVKSCTENRTITDEVSLPNHHHLPLPVCCICFFKTFPSKVRLLTTQTSSHSCSTHTQIELYNNDCCDRPVSSGASLHIITCFCISLQTRFTCVRLYFLSPRPKLTRKQCSSFNRRHGFAVNKSSFVELC